MMRQRARAWLRTVLAHQHVAKLLRLCDVARLDLLALLLQLSVDVLEQRGGGRVGDGAVDAGVCSARARQAERAWPIAGAGLVALCACRGLTRGRATHIHHRRQ
eukprot:7274309-Prymnesium_polylepis.1